MQFEREMSPGAGKCQPFRQTPVPGQKRAEAPGAAVLTKRALV